MAKRKTGERYTFGYFIQFSTTPGGFQDMVWRSMVGAARKKDVNMLLFAGGSVDTAPYNRFEYNVNFIYDLAGSGKLDGLVVNNVVGAYVTEERFREFCRGFGLPVVLAFGSLPGVPGVRVPNRDGMRDVILHLARAHGARRIAFIVGTEGYPDSVERFDVYRETLAECGIAYDPALVFQGAFEIESGAKAVAHWLDETDTAFDAIVSSNDAMAIGAVEALRARGREVPWDAAVTGFDDTAEAGAFAPPLTTVRQPFDEVHAAALEMLCGVVEGRDAPECVSVPAPMVVRRSCGCVSSLAAGTAGGARAQRRAKRSGPAPSPADSAGSIARELCAFAPDEDEEILRRFVSGFIDDAEARRPGTFIPEFSRLIQGKTVTGDAIALWQNILMGLRKRTRPLWKNSKFAARAEDIVLQASVLVGEATTLEASYRKSQSEKQMRELVEGGQELITTFDFEQLKEVVVRRLPRLGIPACHISVFRSGDDPAAGTVDYLSVTGEARTAVTSVSRSVNHLPVLPGGLFFPAGRRFAYAVHPLYFREHRLGYALFELGPAEGVVYNTLEILIASSLMGAELFRRKERIEAEQRERIESQRKYAAELEAAIRELEAFSYTVSHDLRAPLRALNGYAAILTGDFGKDLPPVAARYLETIGENARRMGRLVDGILEFSHLSRRPLARQAVRHADLVREALDILRPELEGRNAKIEIGRLPDGSGDPLLLRQVWVNLIENAIKFTRGREEARIGIGCRAAGGETVGGAGGNDGDSSSGGREVFFVKDNGVGFDMRYADKLFGVFQRLHRVDEYEGTGVGLAVVQRIVQRHGGRVWAEAEPDKGAAFFFTLG
ncbi:MAG: substrate-binding domain-containing protein [Spirochaetales bacterium]|nr:substrate-binding domain-containing protein [Spirochaetales bacterium]